MAFHDFACLDCGSEFEVFAVGFIRDEQKVCPVCGSTHIDQKFSSFLSSAPSYGGGCAAPAGTGFG
jgi:putative FmdB family regulatory protein